VATIVMADDGVAFDGRVAATAPLGGAERAFVSLAEALAARGHRVEVRNRCAGPLEYGGVAWAPLHCGLPQSCDLYIGNRGHRLIGLVPQARRRLFWLHNPADYLKKPRNWRPLAWHQPTIVVTGAYHAATVPRWLAFNGCAVIPYGIGEGFRAGAPRPWEPPPPRAIFTSNPLRGLGWLLDLWAEKIVPAVPQAELHIYAGAGVYRGGMVRHQAQIEAILAQAEALSAQGVRLHDPVPPDLLAVILRGSRAMLYRGDPGETFCLALAEAQASGVPAVVENLGSAGERVIDGVTGCVAAGDADFAEAAIAVLRDDDLWRRWHLAALERQQGLSWDLVAARFEALIP
jgi:glycosyltransferase involved in cell wall biosynthesis